MPFQLVDVRTQASALQKIVEMIQDGSVDPIVRRTALRIISDCAGRDDMCELQAIFDAVKHGTSKVPTLRDGFKYIADPQYADFYVAAKRSLLECQRGACGGDCDDHTILVASLAGSIGFSVGARAWGPPNAKRGTYAHVYPIVKIPKRGPWPKSYTGHGMDTTVEDSTIGWEPPKSSNVLTAWIEEE